MGAGASFETNLVDPQGSNRYFCHSCQHAFHLNDPLSHENFHCPYCQSTFLEEIGANPLNLQHHGRLTLEQTLRITNATAMLRLLELQLREELEHLQTAFETTNSRNQNAKKLTNTMKFRFKNISLTLDDICSQPSCPICNEDFVAQNKVLRLPCGHLYHNQCVMPWLEMKQNCPICRQSLPDDLPTKEDLDNYKIDEIEECLTNIDVNKEDFEDIKNNKEELADMLFKKLQEDETEKLASIEHSSVSENDFVRRIPIFNLAFNRNALFDNFSITPISVTRITPQSISFLESNEGPSDSEIDST